MLPDPTLLDDPTGQDDDEKEEGDGAQDAPGKRQYDTLAMKLCRHAWAVSETLELVPLEIASGVLQYISNETTKERRSKDSSLKGADESNSNSTDGIKNESA